MDRGYIKLWRKIVDNEVMTSADACQMLLFLMGKSTHRPHKIMVSGQVIVLRPGQFFAGRKQLALALKSTEQRVRTALKNLEKCGIINQQTTTKGTLISLINWDKYQGDQPAVNQEPNQRLTSGQPAPNQRLTTKQEDITQSTEEEEILTSTRAGASDHDPGPTAAPPVIDRAAGARLLKIVRPIFEQAWPEAPKVMVEHDEILMHLADNLAINPQRAGPEFWEALAQRSRASPFLRGEKPGKRGLFPGIKFGWFVKPDNVGKILNGDFDEAPSKPPTKAPRKENPSGALEIELI